MSITGVGNYASHYYGFSRTRQTVIHEESFQSNLSWKATVTTQEPGNNQTINCRDLYEAMSKTPCVGKLDENTQAKPSSGAVSLAEQEMEGKFLGLTMVPEEGQTTVYGMRAMLPENSNPENPIVQVISNLGGEKKIYNVEINKVNPDNATQLEMFALLSYADEKGMTDGGTFGSFHQLKVYGSNAGMIGYCNRLEGEAVFVNESFDWPKIIEQMMKDYFEAESYKQSEDCQELLDFFTNCQAKNDTEQEREDIKVIEKSVVSLPSGVSFYIEEESGEVTCVDDTQTGMGRQTLWTKHLSSTELEKCEKLFEKFKGDSTWVYKYNAELRYESFWEKYLSGEIILK